MTPRMQQSDAVELAAIATRVTGLENGLQGVISAIDHLSAKFDAKSQTNWMPIISMMGVATSILGLIGAVVYVPIKDNQIRLELGLATTMQRVEASSEKIRADMLLQREFQSFERDHDRQIERIVKRLDRIEFGPERKGGS